jgi:hypothetical protein
VAAAFLQFEVRYPKQFVLVRYEDLNRSPGVVTRKLFELCGLDLHGQVEEFLRSSKSRHDDDPYSVFRSQANDDRWHGVIPEDIVEQTLREIRETPLNIFSPSDSHA